jgi:hypothetical protein
MKAERERLASVNSKFELFHRVLISIFEDWIDDNFIMV